MLLSRRTYNGLAWLPTRERRPMPHFDLVFQNLKKTLQRKKDLVLAGPGAVGTLALIRGCGGSHGNQRLYMGHIHPPFGRSTPQGTQAARLQVAYSLREKYCIRGPPVLARAGTALALM